MRFFARRLAFYVFTAWAAVTINFLLPRLMPGDPVQAVMERFSGQLSPDATAALATAFGLDKNQSLWSQYIDYWSNLLHGDLGLSFTYFPTPVFQVIAGALPWTIALMGISTLIAGGIGTLLGVMAGWKRGGWMDSLLPIGALLRGVPHFWIGLVLVSVVALGLGWFPVSGGYDPSTTPGWNPEFILSVLQHAVLPALTIVIGSLAGHMLLQRNMMVTTLSEDYVVVAQAKGLSSRRVMTNYAARNAILPAVAGFAMELGLVVSGSLLVEKVFSYPGIGYVLYQAVSNQDYPLLQAILLVTTLAVLAANFLADIAFFALDPRTRNA
ncbi:ABC transporter permease [Leifsonia shinshuensis]|uniref:ABC transporter permease n=1 Tax=Leifsonia shinshuensis TaxID=150026 RepID=A0A7G6YAU6_9MICO|nr:ABC transporter permease [Leifsonia shinshuensis]QNE35611.1 ABC transporter permease [Leifsonia shinshuensis]